jgi:hypothetical protein
LCSSFGKISFIAFIAAITELPFKISKTNFSGYKIENNKLVLIDETKTLDYISAIVKKRTEFFEKQSVFWCKTNQWDCQPLVKNDWLYYLGEDLLGLQRPNRQINLVFPLTEQNIIAFNNKFKEYFLTDPDLVNYLVLNYIFAMIKTPVSLTNKYYQYWNINNFINWYKNYLTQLGLEKYLPTDKGIELIIK